jgi:uncharacterized RDD family membrane protein YckC
MADAQWFAHINGSNAGPLTEAELKAKIEQGVVTATHLVWQPGWAQWKTARAAGLMPHLALVPSSAPLPLPSSAPRNFTGPSTRTSGSEVPPSRTSQNPRATPDLASTRAQDLGADSFGGFWVRFAANVTDNIVLLIPNTIIGVAFNLTMGQTEGTLLSMVFNACTTMAYFSVLQARMEGSLGKKLFGLTLVDEHMQPLSPAAASRRYVMLVLGTLPLGAGAIAAAFHPHKQGWHDRYAGSFVVKRSALDAARACRSPADRLASEHADHQRRAA